LVALLLLLLACVLHLPRAMLSKALHAAVRRCTAQQYGRGLMTGGVVRVLGSCSGSVVAARPPARPLGATTALGGVRLTSTINDTPCSSASGSAPTTMSLWRHCYIPPPTTMHANNAVLAGTTRARLARLFGTTSNPDPSSKPKPEASSSEPPADKPADSEQPQQSQQQQQQKKSAGAPGGGPAPPPPPPGAGGPMSMRPRTAIVIAAVALGLVLAVNAVAPGPGTFQDFVQQHLSTGNVGSIVVKGNTAWAYAADDSHSALRPARPIVLSNAAAGGSSSASPDAAAAGSDHHDGSSTPAASPTASAASGVAMAPTRPGRHLAWFTISSPEQFEKQMDEMTYILGVPDVPIIYKTSAFAYDTTPTRPRTHARTRRFYL